MVSDLSPRLLRVGTRGSQLALRQAEVVKEAIEEKFPDIDCSLVSVKTTGDLKQSVVGDKREWILELEQGLVQGSFDLVVHSAKDVPVTVDPVTGILPVLERACPFDSLIIHQDLRDQKSARGTNLLDILPLSSRVGTSSKRRTAQLLRLRPDLEVARARGNVTSRLTGLQKNSEVFALILAYAGLERLLLTQEAFGIFTDEEFLPAMNQGILVVQYSLERRDIIETISKLVNNDTLLCFNAERAFISGLGADCHSAVGVLARVCGDKVVLKGEVLSHDGSSSISGEIEGSYADSIRIGEALASQLLSKGARDLLLG